MLTSRVGAVAVPRQRGSWKPTPNMSEDLRILVTVQVILLSLYHETFIGFMMIHGSLWIIVDHCLFLINFIKNLSLTNFV